VHIGALGVWSLENFSLAAALFDMFKIDQTFSTHCASGVWLSLLQNYGAWSVQMERWLRAVFANHRPAHQRQILPGGMTRLAPDQTTATTKRDQKGLSTGRI
jgi:hypothetical protein